MSSTGILARWKEKARALKVQTYALYLAYRDPRVPWYAKLFTALIVAYAFSPIDLIPDFIPVLGYLDDLIIIPLAVTLALKMIPKDVMDECRAEAQTRLESGDPEFKIMGFVVIGIWIAVFVLVIYLVYKAVRKS
jgi:uncharacterized membrane protein YkvA (DUF1232 family)